MQHSYSIRLLLVSFLAFGLPLALASPASADEGAAGDSGDAADATAAAPASAKDATLTEADARTFMSKVLDRSAWNDMTGQVTLLLTNERGKTRERRIEMWSKKNEAGESRMLMRFLSPADVKGVGFLLVEHDGADDDRRLWMPALRRVQRISASGAGGYFMSSDFTYYDIGRPELTDWTWAFDGQGEVDGVPCRKVVAKPASEQVEDDTGYGRVTWCVDTGRMVSLGAKYLDDDGLPLKTLTVLEVKDVGGVPFATRMRMVNDESGHASEMTFADLEVDTGIEDQRFTERFLRRGR